MGESELTRLNEDLGKKIALSDDEEENSKKKYIKEVFFPQKNRNFCKRFRLEDDIKEKTFNNKYNDPGLIHVFYRKNDYTESFLKSIQTRIRNQTNIILVIYGEPHSGKSEVGQSIAFNIVESFKEQLELSVRIRLGFSTSEFDGILRKLKKGDVAIRDESPKASGAGARTIKNNLDNIVEIVRANQNSFIFISPRKVEASVVTYYLEVAGKDYDNRKVRCILYDPAHKDGKEPIGRIFFSLHENDRFRKNYEKKKLRNIEGILRNAGQVTVEINEERFNRDLDSLLEICRESGVKSKRDIESRIRAYNAKHEKQEDKIKGTGKYIDNLVDETYLIISNKIKRSEVKEKKKDGKEEEKKDDLEIFKKYIFKYTNEEIMDKVKKESNYKNPERDFSIYHERVVNNTLREDIIAKHESISTGSAVSNIIRKINGKKAYVKGKLFEKEYFKFLKETKLYDKVIWDGAAGKADVFAYFERNQALHIFSLKHFDYEYGKGYVIKDGMRPEYRLALESLLDHKEVRMFLVVLDCVKDRVGVIDVDFRNPKNEKVF
ncbi:MAG: hypothetical protein GY853_15840 [PVC group bacterium]|nr:hypothetical protein [PVC group bacterium]